MPPFRFIQAHLPDPAHSKAQITERLLAHRRKLLAARQKMSATREEAQSKDEPDWLSPKDPLRLDPEESRKIERRATKVSDRCSQSGGLSHLKPDDLKKLEALRGGVRLVQIATEHQADELAAALHAEFPWMGPATEAVWHGMRRSVREGDIGLRLPPLLLDGPPGIGKSAWARSLGELIKVPTMVYEATVENASFGLVGSQRNWGSANPGRLLNTILSTRVGNPVVVIDEVEKSGRAESNKGQVFSLTDALLPLLEPLSAAKWSCPYFEVKFDMSYVIWVMTSNNAASLPEPLLSRCPSIQLRGISAAELTTFARREGQRRNLDDASIDAVVEAIERHRQSAVSLRTVMRMIQRAVQLQAPGARLH
jgi:hypothetical protein